MSRLNECKSNWTTNAKPGLVEKWEVSADSKTWTFKLRPNVKFHDGTPFDADAVVFNFQRWMDAKNPYHKSGDFTYWHDLERNNDYWDKANMPKLDEIAFRVIKDNTARFLELNAGTIQGMEGLYPDDVAAAQKDPNLKIELRPAMNVAYLAFNFTNQYLAKKEVRQAIAYAINRQGIVDALYSGTGQVASQFLPPPVWGYNPDVKPYPYDPAKAKALLAQAGVPDGFSIDLWHMPVSRPYYPSPKPICEAIAADLAKVGIKANLKTEDWSLYTADRKKGAFPWPLGLRRHSVAQLPGHPVDAHGDRRDFRGGQPRGGHAVRGPGSQNQVVVI